MLWKTIAGLIAVAWMVAFLLPTAIKLKDVALATAIAIGVVLMLVDLYQSLHERE